MAEVSKRFKIICNHPKENQVITVVSAICGCETTRIKCTKCGEFITKPKIDC